MKRNCEMKCLCFQMTGNLALAFSVYQSDKFTPFAMLSLLKVFPLKL